MVQPQSSGTDSGRFPAGTQPALSRVACHYPDYHLMTRTVSGPRTELAADREKHPEMGLLMLSRMWETKGRVTDGEHTEKLLLQDPL